MKNFVVISDNRSGSHFLQSLLNDHPEIHCNAELFWDNGPNTAGYGHFCRETNLTFIQKISTQHRMRAYFDYFHNLVDENVIGYLLKYVQLKNIHGIKQYIKSNNIQVIHLIRKNLIIKEIAIAKRKAKHAEVSMDDDNYEKIYLEPDQLLKNLAMRQKRIETYDAMFDTSMVHKVYYEDILDNRSEILKNIFELLQVDSSIEVETNLVKIESEDPSEMIENYIEVKNALKNSPFSEFIV